MYEVEVAVILYLLRKNQAEAHRLEHRVAYYSSVSTRKEDPSEMKPTPGRSHGLCEGGGGAGHFRISRISSP